MTDNEAFEINRRTVEVADPEAEALIVTEYTDAAESNFNDAEEALAEAFNNSAYINNEELSREIGKAHVLVRSVLNSIQVYQRTIDKGN